MISQAFNADDLPLTPLKRQLFIPSTWSLMAHNRQGYLCCVLTRLGQQTHRPPSCRKGTETLTEPHGHVYCDVLTLPLLAELTTSFVLGGPVILLCSPTLTTLQRVLLCRLLLCRLFGLVVFCIW